MKTSTQLTLWSLAWVALSFVTLFTGAHFAWTASLVGTVTYTVGAQLARLIEKQNGGTNK